jgi:hypothetical protein
MIHKLVLSGEKNMALRFSEFEGLDTIRNMKNTLNWVWIDCFTQNPLTLEIYNQLKGMNFKLCFVSPELQQQTEKLLKYKEYFQKNDIILDMICTKHYNIEKWK